MARRERRLAALVGVAALVAIALFVSACTSSGDGTTGTDQTTTTSAAPESQGVPASTGGPGSSTPELTATFRGVTADRITVGVASADLAYVNETFGLDFTVLPLEELYEAWAGVVNEAGGINGREIAFEFRSFEPIGPDDSDRVCLELMEDEEVFVVIGQFLQDNMLCITQTHGHPYVGSFGETPDRQAQSDGLLFAVEIAQVDQRRGGTQAMIDAGDFDDKKVAVVWESSVDAVYFDAVTPVLDAAGVEVVVALEVDAFTTDEVNNEAAWAIAMERIAAEEADVILNLSNVLGVVDAVERAGVDVTIAHTNGQAADGPSILEGAIAGDDVLSNSFAVTTWKPDKDEALADAGVQRCLAEFEAAFPDVAIDLTDDDWVAGIRTNCQAFELTRMILEAAGPELTPETFRAAGEGLGPVDLPGLPDGFLGPDKHSAGALLSRYEYDVERAQYVKVGDPIPAT